MSTLLSVESDGVPIQFDLSFQQSAFVPFWDGSWATLVSTPSYSFHSNSFITPHPFILVLLKFPYWHPIHTCALIDSGSQSSLIRESFVHRNFLLWKSLDPPIPIQGLDGNSLGNSCIAHTILTNLCIENHFKTKDFSIVQMNCNLVLGIDWLHKHNPVINWESNSIQFMCCDSDQVKPRSGDAQPSNLIVPIQMGDVNMEMSGPGNSIDIAMLTEDEFFGQGWITAFGLINFIPNSINVATSVSNIISDNSILVPEAIDKIKAKVPEKYHGFINVFINKEATTLSPHCDQDIKIKLVEGKVPPFNLIYSLTPMEKEALHSYISENLVKGFICHSISSAASPILFVKKPNSSLQLCVDYQGLNAITKHNRYLLPLINELLNSVGGCHVFTKLNLKSAFNLLRIASGDEWKMAFHTNEGLFEYLVMSFRLTNAPTAFQSFIQWVLHEYLNITCVVYLDDILIFSKMQFEHDLHVLQVLCALNQYGLLASVNKCEFNKESLEYLGFIIGKDGISMHPSKLSTISNWPEPQSAKEIQHFSRTCKFLSMIYFPLCLHCSAAIQLNMKGSFGFICFVPYCPFHLQLSQIHLPICPCSYSS